MTPVVSWDYDAYYRAIDRARWAWQQSQPQLTIDGFAGALDEADERASVRLLERTPRLTHGAEPHCPGRSHRPADGRFPVSPPDQGDASAPSLTTTEAGAMLMGESRARLQEVIVP